ncbi:4-hydroxy-tetrahydrodipicolinate synthase [Paenibacillus sp. PsM32]|uniref:4-hydroxy-tetrahydrodipicolinate synthase n=1 Tax=Paenibacillus sp. PsM32 TaxID=3030536 RepID=UPI00263A725F|nr:4-hydroxy-tetrahydrodipicolinate synthase [Paenibacillus sp. PsM32]MDN4616496.1 4-hydroxy-tetrahydrodipicolinate synthase [Paenibacillus sp. PsM32]
MVDFGRLMTAMITPFNEQDEIDWDATARLIDYLIDEQKSESLVVCGTTGESPTLSDEEKLQMFEFAVKHAAGRCKIIAGTGSNETRHSIHLTREASKLGIDGVLIVVPYYNKPNQAGIYAHFKVIAEATDLPVIMYNVPGRTITSMSVATTLKLAEIPNVVGTKECASLEQVTQIVAHAPKGFLVYSGDDSSGLPALAVGAHGIISVASHVVGTEMTDMIEAYLAGRPVEAAKLNQKLFPIFKGLFESPEPLPNPSAVKYELSKRGFGNGNVRLPLLPPTEQEQQFIDQLFV